MNSLARPLTLLLLAMTVHLLKAETLLFDFTATTNRSPWQIVNDDVMGGVSTSHWESASSSAVFQGNLSLDNNGGFASVRSSPLTQDLTGVEAFAIRVRGDGRRYKFTVRTDRSVDTVLYQTTFETQPGEWKEHLLPLKEFLPTFRGRVLTGEPPLDPARVASVGFLISDKQAGPFRLETAWIKVTKAAAP